MQNSSNMAALLHQTSPQRHYCISLCCYTCATNKRKGCIQIQTPMTVPWYLLNTKPQCWVSPKQAEVKSNPRGSRKTQAKPQHTNSWKWWCVIANCCMFTKGVWYTLCRCIPDVAAWHVITGRSDAGSNSRGFPSTHFCSISCCCETN